MKTLLLLFCMFCCVPMWSQLEINLEIDFNAQFGQEYIPLEEFTNLTEGMGAWNHTDMYEYEDYELSTPLIFPGFEDRPMDRADLGAYGDMFIEYYNWPEDPYDIYLNGLALDYGVLSPLNDEKNEDQGYILLHESDGIIIFELRNVALEEELEVGDGDLISRINLQIEIHFEDLCVQYNYGPSIITPTMEQYFEEYMPVGAVFGWFYEELIDGNWEEDYLDLVGILSGDPNNPHFHQLWIDMDFDEEVEFLNAFPEEGTVYRFCFSETTSVHELSAGESALRLFPNPASTELFVDLSGSDSGAFNSYLVQIVDIHGKVLLEKEIESHRSVVDIESLPNGLYLLRIKGDHFTEVKKFFKH